MSELTDTLEKVIQQAALDGALTADAVAQFHSLVVERNALKEANEEWEETDKQHIKDRADLNQMISQANTELGEYQTRESELQEREKKITEMEVREECTMLRIADHQEMFRVVFRNAVVRKEVMSPTYDFMDSNGATRSSSELRNTLEEEEK